MIEMQWSFVKQLGCEVTPRREKGKLGEEPYLSQQQGNCYALRQQTTRGAASGRRDCLPRAAANLLRFRSVGVAIRDASQLCQ